MRRFNITGKIIPEKHYCVDLTPQLEKLMALAENGTYFVINRPWQFGKTTPLDLFARRLHVSGSYAPALISFESFTQRAGITETEFYSKVAKLIDEELMLIGVGHEKIHTAPLPINTRDNFFDWLRATCGASKKLVLLIDEMDAVPETVVIGFLTGLRERLDVQKNSVRRKPYRRHLLLQKSKKMVELKLWYGERGYDQGLEQLANYLESESLSRGYLVVFDRRDNAPKEYLFSEHEVMGKKIQAWVI